jgi:hypothetical protein
MEFFDKCNSYGIVGEVRNVLYLLNRIEKGIKPHRYFVFTKGTNLKAESIKIPGFIKIPLPQSKITVWAFTTMKAKSDFVAQVTGQVDFLEF